MITLNDGPSYGSPMYKREKLSQKELLRMADETHEDIDNQWDEVEKLSALTAEKKGREVSVILSYKRYNEEVICQ